MPKPPDAPGSWRDRAILVVGLVADRIGIALLYIVFGPIVREVGLSELQFGLLVASANVTLGIASPWWGRRSQVIGRRPVFVIGLSGYALGFVILGLALEAGLAGWLGATALFGILLAVRLGYGFVAAATQPAATAYIADITAAHERTRGMALLGIAAGVGTILGPVVGGAFTALGAVFPLYLAAGIAAVAAGLAAAALREPVRHVVPAGDSRPPLRLLDPRLLPYLAGWCLCVLVLTGVQTVTVFHIEDRIGLTDRQAVTQATSVALLAMGAAMVFTQAVVLQLFRLRPTVLLRAGFLLLTVALGVLLLAGSQFILYVAYGLMGLGFSLLTSGLNAGATLEVRPDEQGAAAGYLAAAPVLGMVIGPVLATAIYGVEPGWPFLGGALACLAMAIWFLFGR